MKIINEWFQYREMFVGLVSREVRARYRGSVLGYVWTLLNPLMLMAVYSLIFSVFMRSGVPNFGVFVFCGLLPWLWFTGALTNATGSIVANSGLIKKIYFPTELLPLVAVTSNLINFVFSLPILFAFLFFSGYQPSLPWLALPLIVAIQFLFTTGVALLLAMLNTFFRDTEQLLGVLLMIWFYLTPILYPTSFVPDRFAPLMAVNPMYSLTEAYRRIFLEGQWPSAGGLAFALGVSVVLIAIVFPIFNRQKFSFAEVV